MENEIIIPHAEDLKVLYNGKDKHDKIYVLAVTKDFYGNYAVYSFYKARTAKNYRWSIVVTAHSHEYAARSAAELAVKKLTKGYEEMKNDKELKALGIDGFQSLKSRLESLLNGLPQETATSGEEVIMEQYECIDDFNISQWFAIGCWYQGFSSGKKLMVIGDDSKKHEVNPENFTLIKE